MTEERRAALGMFGGFIGLLASVGVFFDSALAGHSLLEPVQNFQTLPIALAVMLLFAFFIAWMSDNFDRMRPVYIAISVGVAASLLVFPIIQPEYTFVEAKEIVETVHKEEAEFVSVEIEQPSGINYYLVHTKTGGQFKVDPYSGESEEMQRVAEESGVK
ncbi:PepSY domain-containing protein [Chryseomicrobium palamuruense]